MRPGALRRRPREATRRSTPAFAASTKRLPLLRFPESFHPTYPRVTGGRYVSGMVAELGLGGGGPDWHAVRADYDDGMLLAELYGKHRISSSQLSGRITKEAWPRRNRSRVVDRPMIITRMFRVLERQVVDLEMEMAEMTRNAKRSGDKEVVLLGKLASTLDKLMDLDVRAGEGRRTKTRTKAMQDIHHKLIERIEQLKRG